jgi:hypothetical protein
MSVYIRKGRTARGERVFTVVKATPRFRNVSKSPARLTHVCKSPPAAEPAAAPPPPAPAAAPRADPFDIMRNAPKRRASREQLEALADRWRR